MNFIKPSLKVKYVKIFENILKNNLFSKKEDKILIITDLDEKKYPAAYNLALYYRKAAENLKFDVEFIIIERITNKKQKVSKNLLNKLKSLPKQSIIITSLSNGIGSTKEFSSLRDFAKINKHKYCVQNSLGEITKKDFDKLLEAYNIDYAQIKNKADSLAFKIKKASKIRIKNKIGTDLECTISKSPIHISAGVLEKFPSSANLPGAEVYFPPEIGSVSGKVVADLTFKSTKGSIKVKNNVTLLIKNSVVEKIIGAEEAEILIQDLKSFDKLCLNKENYKIAEIGIGLNNKAKHIGSVLIDEKIYTTAHIAIGNNKWFGGDLSAPFHFDIIFSNVEVYLDDKLIKY